ncbi:hypothetical protein O181_054743, partial [Austropuccinia psidii MF-1]|nr:hypothetical protein [Austropuccinia psidii MF-1]
TTPTTVNGTFELCFHLRSKDLLEICEKPLEEGSTPTTFNKYTKESHEAINIIASRLSHIVFLEVINKETKENAHLLWTKINNQYYSERAINRGRVWMDWICSHYHGNLQDYINSCRKMNLELDAVNINIEAELLSFSILGQLVRDPKLQHYVDSLTLNDYLNENPDLILTKLQDFVNNLFIQPEKINTPSSAVTTSAQPYKITHYCANGKHNLNCTSHSTGSHVGGPRLTHSKEQCFAESPNLRLERRNNQRRFLSNIPPSAQASALITGSPDLLSSIKLIIDCGATHPMFNCKTLFSTLNKIPPLRISMGDSSSSLVEEGIGTVNLTFKEATLSLKSCLYVPKRNCNLVSLLKLFQEKIIITRKDNSFSLDSNNILLLKGKILNNILIFNYSNPKSLLTATRDSLWHNLLEHPGDGPLKSMGLSTNSLSCKACLNNKAHKLPFNDHFDPVHHPLDYKIHPYLSCGSVIVSPCQEGQDSVVDEVQHPSPEVESRPHQQIRVIGPQHPTLVSCDLNPENILPYTWRPLVLFTSNDVVSRTFKNALSSPAKDLWLISINKELKSMNALGLWDVIELDPFFKLVGTTWVFKIKKDHLGHITEYKARLCAQGFPQSEGIDFNQTYAPTGRLNLLQTLIAFAAARDLKFHQIDIKSCFPNAPLLETFYLGTPQGLRIDRRERCLRLWKAIYGLRVSNPILLYIHVEEIAIFGKQVDNFKKEVLKEFEIKDIGPADLILGIKVTHFPYYVFLDQHHFTESLLELYGMCDCNQVFTPLVPNEHLSLASPDEVSEFEKLKVHF